jgi:exopolysaccharide biosynthesis polyprenyl glycosylphosphotransferase
VSNLSQHHFLKGWWMTPFSSSLPAESDMGPAAFRKWTTAARVATGPRLGSSRVEVRAPLTLAPSVDAAAGQSTRRAHVLGESLFRSALIRERRRADRFEESFFLLLIELGGDASTQPAVASSVLMSLTAATREADVVGWFRRDMVLGVIVPDASGTSEMPDFEARVRRELKLRVHAEMLGHLSFSLHRYSGPKGMEGIEVDANPLVAVGARREKKGLRDGLKRGLDIVSSLALLLLLSPIFAVVGLLVKLTSRGPVFFRQTRVGEGAKPFTMLKFRTMHANADSALHHQFVTNFIQSRGTQAAGKTEVFKIENDPRVTSIGRFLRKTSLDELPQFWNVLRGDMSMVGPRPPLRYELEQYRSWHWRRVLEAKPGVTGLWQVRGRSRTTFDEMVRLDLQYVRTRSLWTDVRILFATPRAVVSGKGAC